MLNYTREIHCEYGNDYTEKKTQSYLIEFLRHSPDDLRVLHVAEHFSTDHTWCTEGLDGPFNTRSRTPPRRQEYQICPSSFSLGHTDSNVFLNALKKKESKIP